MFTEVAIKARSIRTTHVAQTGEGRSALKTREQVRAEFDRKGLSVAAWARENKVSQSTAYQVLYGTKKGRRGEAHKVAVLLGIKEGVLA